MDKIYFRDKGNYITYFDFGYPERLINSDNQVTKSDVQELHDSASAPIVYYDFTQDYIDRLLDKASNKKEGQIKALSSDLGNESVFYKDHVIM